jgi:hypothetical protein
MQRTLVGKMWNTNILHVIGLLSLQLQRVSSEFLNACLSFRDPDHNLLLLDT